ncbi:MAG: thiamine phosphate synthase [Rhodobacteraceae bacterium]|nr:thiamine phosphate synthase [Paracoccaceae bacterium]
MDSPQQPQIYLVTPLAFEPDSFCQRLAPVLDSVEIACIRLHLAGRDEDGVLRAADALREVAHARDIALVIADHQILAQRLGLDGVHLGDGARSVRAARRALGPDAIVGAFCGASRHDGISAGEAGADYIAFGPAAAGALGDGAAAGIELFRWWSEMIELPVVAEGGLSPALVRELAPHTDFFAIGEEIWASDDPLQALEDLTQAMR